VDITKDHSTDNCRVWLLVNGASKKFSASSTPPLASAVASLSAVYNFQVTSPSGARWAAAVMNDTDDRIGVLNS